ncbi:hypothetical protein CTI12_AA466490 [Artemisia annua]|uniref:Uncharacterized protein n=1 Tax=Artemisia annua TaxID=35608 RepID=A0A2U1LQ24_ARTAN|nr:hypothetical protein CTI12_AA466490 [Artemisia annua]
MSKSLDLTPSKSLDPKLRKSLQSNPYQIAKIGSYSDYEYSDLGNANLTGPLAWQLGQLRNLQYLELYSNNINGEFLECLGT